MTVIELEISKGHLKWRVADLARLAKASRPLVYYHFGKTKKEILETCIELIALEYFGLSGERRDSLKKGQALESLRQTRLAFLKKPSLAIFYLKWRMQSSPIQKKLIEIELRYQQKLREAFPYLETAHVEVAHALLHGLITAPFLSNEAFEVGVKAAMNWIESQR